MKICHFCKKQNPDIPIEAITLQLKFINEYTAIVPYYDCPNCGGRFSADHVRGALWEGGRRSRFDG